MPYRIRISNGTASFVYKQGAIYKDELLAHIEVLTICGYGLIYNTYPGWCSIKVEETETIKTDKI